MKVEVSTNLSRLSHFLPNDLPLVVLVVFDGLQKRGALSRRSAVLVPIDHEGCEADEIADLVFREFGVMHVLLGKRRDV